MWDRRQGPPAKLAAGAGAAPPALVAVDLDYMGLLVWIGQNLVCVAEERGWRATLLLLEEALQVGGRTGPAGRARGWLS